MNCKVENGMLIMDIDGKSYSFEAHAEAPRPSLLGRGLSAGGRHWSSRDPEVKSEKHTSIQDIALGEDMVAWYVQEFAPNGEDYKLTKNAQIYLGCLSTGEHKLIYKGECYGDLCFDGTDLYINTGNKVAVIDTVTGESKVLFKHSGIKKNGINLHITEKRIFFIHWTHNETYFMWYDRENDKVVNSHIDIGRHYFLNDETVIYQALSHTWILDTNTAKKKRFFSAKLHKAALKLVCDFGGLPVDKYSECFVIKMTACENERIYCCCHSTYHSQFPEHIHNANANVEESFSKNLPWSFWLEISCKSDGTDMRMEVTKENIEITVDDDVDLIRWKAVPHGTY